MKHSVIILFLLFCSTCYGTLVYDHQKPSVTDTFDMGSISLKWEDGFFNGDLSAGTFTGDGSGLTGIGSGTGGVINTGSTTIGADSDSDGVGILVLQTRGTTRLTVANNGDIVIAGTITGGTWNGTAIDISSYTNLVAGTNITLSGDTLNVDDAFIVNNASDTMTGTLTTDGITITTGNALTLGTTQWDDGSDKIEGNILADNSVDDDALDFTSITLNDFTVDIASTQLTDTADILYEAELDTFAELQTQIADKTLLNEEDVATIDSAWTFNGGITGTLTGNVTGNLTGNANTAELLQNTRTFSVSGDVATSLGVTFNGGGNVDLSVSFTPGIIVDADVSTIANISADKLTDGPLNAIVTLAQESNWDIHLTSDGSDHTFIDQDVTSGSSPTFTNLTSIGLDVGGGRIINVATPTVSTDAANKQYVDDTAAAPGHNILSTAHGDTRTQAVSRGSIIYGNSDPNWGELVIGPANFALVSDGTDIAWVDKYLRNDADDITTGVLTVEGVGGNGLTGYDLKVGDTTTPDYGLIQTGNAAFGRVPYNAMNMDLDGVVIIRNLEVPATSNIEFAFLESGGTSIRFALAKSAVGNATYNPRSMLIAGPAVWNDEIVTVGYWQTNNSIFDNLACDTSGTGADLGVQNDLEVEGDIFVDSIKESTPGSGITFSDDVLMLTSKKIFFRNTNTFIHSFSTNAINLAASTFAITANTIMQGNLIIDNTSVAALTIRKDGATGNVVIVDTTNKEVEIYDSLGIGKTPTAGVAADVVGAGVFDGNADTIQLRVQGHSTQTSDIFVVERSNGTDLVAVRTNGLYTVDLYPLFDDDAFLGNSELRWKYLSVSQEAYISTLTLAGGSITDSSGTISFSNENLTTSGTGHFGGDLDTDSDLIVDGQAAIGAAINSGRGVNIDFSSSTITRGMFASLVYLGTDSTVVGLLAKGYSFVSSLTGNQTVEGGRFDAQAGTNNVANGVTYEMIGGRFLATDRSTTYQATGTYNFKGGLLAVQDLGGDWSANPTVTSFDAHIGLATAPTFGSNHTHWQIYAPQTGSISAIAGKLRIGSVVAPTVALDVTGAALISTTLGVTGQTLFSDKVKFTQTNGDEYIDSLANGYLDYSATIAHRFNMSVLNRNVRLEFIGTTKSGLFEWLEDEDAFNFANKVIIGGTTPDSLFEVDGALGLAIETVTGNTTLDETHSTVLVDASGNVIITLPPAADAYNNTDNIGRIHEVKKIDADADTVTVDPNGSEEIEFAPKAVLTVQGETITFQSNGTAWFIL